MEKSRTKKGHCLKNTGTDRDVLTLDNEKNEFYGNEYISSFDFSLDDKSIVYIKNSKLCLDMCSSLVLKKQMSELLAFSFAEVKIVNDRFYLLRTNGELLSNDLRCSGEHNVYSIDEVLRRYQ